MRKNIFKLISILSVASMAILTSCNSKNKNDSAVELAKANKLNDSYYYTKLDDNYTSSVLETNANLATICNNIENNSCVSPFSIYSTLAMISGVTSGNTQKEILDYLNTDYSTLKTNYKDLYKSVYRYNTETKEINGILNNSMWLNKNFKYNLENIKKASDDFYADIFALNFNSPTSSKYINNYIKNKTFNLIDENFQFTSNTALALINTIYLKDNWLEFGNDLDLSKEKIQFTNSKNEIKLDYFLTKQETGKIYNNDYIKSFRICSNNYKVTFIVPNDDYKIKDVFTKDNIKEALTANYYNYDTSLYRYYTTTYFPTFSGETKMELSETLKNAGIKDVFNSLTADFSNISNDSLYLDTVDHVAKIDVNKKGLTGAAVTVATMKSTSAYEQIKNIYESFYVDKSFGYLVTGSHNNILLAGIINNI